MRMQGIFVYSDLEIRFRNTVVYVGARRRVQLLAIFGDFGSDSRDDE